MKLEERTRIISLIEKTVDLYGNMLQKIVIEKDKEFNAIPFERSISALNQLLDKKEDNE